MDFRDRCALGLPLDAGKRVHYSHGLVLGVGEFRTEQHYFLAQDRRHHRALHGYGTVAGLAVTVRDTPQGPEVRVEAGLAIDPHGRPICVPEAQCARLNDWLLRRQELDGSPPLDFPPSPLTVSVRLCYRECETDRVPIPVGPCHSLDTSTVPSRIQEAFELRLVERPAGGVDDALEREQPEEQAVRRLGELLGALRVADEPGALTTPDDLVAAIRALAPASPPGGGAPPAFVLHPDAARAIVREALRVWVTEVRPLLVPEGGGCLGGPRDETCVLLADLEFEVQDVGGGLQVSGPVRIDEAHRPFLLHTRALQELLLAGVLGEGEAPGPPAPPAPEPEPEPVVSPAVTGPAIIRLPAASAMPVADATAEPFEGVPAFRVRRNGSVAFSFAPPTDIEPGTPLSVRLRWVYQRTPTSSPTLSWQVGLRLFGPNAELAAATPAEAELTPIVPSGTRGRLQEVTGDLAVTVPANALLAVLTVGLETTAAINNNTSFYLLMVELQYTRSAP